MQAVEGAMTMEEFQSSIRSQLAIPKTATEARTDIDWADRPTDVVDEKPKPGKIIATGGTKGAPKVVSYSSGKVGKPLWEKAGMDENLFRDLMAEASRLGHEDRSYSERFREADEAGDMETANAMLAKIREQNARNAISSSLRAAVLDGDRERIKALLTQADIASRYRDRL